MPLSIEIVTPEQRVLTTQCDEVRLPGTEGGFGTVLCATGGIA